MIRLGSHRGNDDARDFEIFATVRLKVKTDDKDISVCISLMR